MLKRFTPKNSIFDFTEILNPRSPIVVCELQLCVDKCAEKAARYKVLSSQVLKKSFGNITTKIENISSFKCFSSIFGLQANAYGPYCA